MAKQGVSLLSSKIIQIVCKLMIKWPYFSLYKQFPNEFMCQSPVSSLLKYSMMIIFIDCAPIQSKWFAFECG